VLSPQIAYDHPTMASGGDGAVRQALQSYQQQNQLNADGVAGPKTQNSLGLY
jgi:peptidoglycan hydrolase-like protein with peptidoglycan-binding domain